MPVSVRREITEQRETMHVVAHSFCMCSHVSCAVGRINQLNSFLPCSLVAVVLCRTVQRHFKSKEVMPAFMQRECFLLLLTLLLISVVVDFIVFVFDCHPSIAGLPAYQLHRRFVQRVRCKQVVPSCLSAHFIYSVWHVVNDKKLVTCDERLVASV